MIGFVEQLDKGFILYNMRRVLKGAFAYDPSLSVVGGWLDIKIQLVTNGIFMIWIVLGAMIFFILFFIM